MKKILLTFLMLICLFSFTSCSNSTNLEKGFFKFLQNGKALEEYAKNQIKESKIVEIVKKQYSDLENKSNTVKLTSAITDLTEEEGNTIPQTLTEDEIGTYLSTYGGLSIVTNYLPDNEKNKFEQKEDKIFGTQLKTVIQRNYYELYGQIEAAILVLNEDIINYLQSLDEKFQNSKYKKIAPFNNAVTYHQDAMGYPVIHISDFAELPASVVGGIGCFYRQDIEAVYDNENKIKIWQTSLGVYTSTPNGTVYEGIILKIDFDWALKD